MTPFDKFCQNQNLLPSQAYKLMQLAHKAFRAGERTASITPLNDDHYQMLLKRELATAQELSKFAASLGFGVEWNGLWPTLTKDGYDVYIPEEIE